MKISMKIFGGFFLLFVLAWSPMSWGETYRLAFGSCNKQNGNQDIWKDLVRAKPKMFMWLGDSVYADATDPKKLEAEYAKLLSHPNYAKARASIPMIGIWDDHDYGKNNAGIENPIKKESQQIFLNFLGEQSASERRRREGLYASHDIVHDGVQAKIILLETRYFRTSRAQKHSKLLGEDQWVWLERTLADSKADVHFLVSGISVLSGLLPASEQWENFPSEMSRLFLALQKSNTKNVVFLTGDRHFAGVIERKINQVKYVELMSSGINHHVLPGPPRTFMLSIYKGLAWFDKHIGLLDMERKGKEFEVRFRTLSRGDIIRDRYALKLSLD